MGTKWEAQKVVTVSQVIQKNGFTMQVISLNKEQ
jgi:hypothetical protein